MHQQCCKYCKKWGKDSGMFKTTVKKFRGREIAYFCNVDHSVRWKKLHEFSRISSVRARYVRS